MNADWKEILLVEDNPGDARLLREALAEADRADEFRLSWVETLGRALQRLANGGVDIVVLDLSLPDEHGLDTLRRARAAAPNIPVVVLTGLDDEATAMQAVREGAQDYLVKGQVDGNSLARALFYAIERQHLQTEVDKAGQHQLEMKDQFLSHVSHELRSPLTVIHQYVTILLDNLAGELNPEQRDCLEITFRNVEQLRAMIGDLLEGMLAETGKLTVAPRVTFVPEIVSDCVRTLKRSAATKGIQLSAEVSDHLPPAYADPHRLRQILINLIDNGLKFTAERGQVVVRARVFEADPDFLCLAVADTGCGISSEGTQKIFERFYQEPNAIEMSRKGLGLGLYICKELVSRHSGQIWVESEPGHGSTFHFTLPVFSLTSLLFPVITQDDHLRESIALITISVTASGKRSVMGPEDSVLQQVWEVLQRCALPDLDVLLPRLARAAQGEIFFIVACTDLSGTEVMVRRIRNQIGRNKGLQAAELDVAVSATMVETGPREDDRPLTLAVEEVVARINVLIKTAQERYSLHEEKDSDC